MAEQIGYDYQPETASGIFLRLRKKGDTIKIRLVSTPVHFQREYEGKKREQFGWLVIDRKDEQVKVFTSGVSIYLTIKGYFENEEWGDPTKYDWAITRTEESTANYYRIEPSPNKRDLTEKELKLVKECKIDLLELLGGKGTNTFGEAGKRIEKQEEPEENGEKINPSDIPF